jgi:tRNA A37 threonylcarbamoyladenosine biosynthesis protein TsaE
MSEHNLMIEWPERIEDLLPAERLWIDLEALEDDLMRHITLEASGPRYTALLRDLLRNLEGQA